MEAATRSAEPPVDPLVLATLRRQLADALGPDVGVACSGVDGDPSSLFSAERSAIQRAVGKRQREFAAGRAVARAAMVGLGWPATVIPVAADRAPIWPDGLVGSIAHSAQVCVAIIGRKAQVHALGIDIEADVALDPTLWPTICTPGELVALESLPVRDRGRWVTRLFCAKEAFYKWQYPQTGRMLDFGDVQVAWGARTSGFSVCATVTGGPSTLVCKSEGQLQTLHGWVLAWLVGPPKPQEQGA